MSDAYGEQGSGIVIPAPYVINSSIGDDDDVEIEECEQCGDDVYACNCVDDEDEDDD